MSERPIISVSGIRGIFGQSLTVRDAAEFAAAFGTHLGKQAGKTGPLIVLGRDSRTSGYTLSLTVTAALVSTGCRVVDLGLVPTPTAAIYIKRIDASGAVVITASHNPAEWNGLKLMNGDGLFPDGTESDEIVRIRDDGSYRWSDYRQLGSIEERDDAVAYHLESILKLPYLDVDRIRRRKFRVALDAVRGAGGPIMKELLERLGCRVEGIDLETDGLFRRDPEPRSDNLQDLCDLVKGSGADSGLACDPDVDRLTLVDELGRPISEEMTIVLASQYILGKKPGPMAVNLSTTRAMDDLAGKFGVRLYRSAVGEINVVKEMVRSGAVIGGEGNGGVILPDLHLGRDAPLAATLVLSLMAQTGKALSELVGQHRCYHMAKIKYSTRDIDPDGLLGKLPDRLPSGKIDLRDGLRLDFSYGWIHARKSNTEPIVRVVMETDSADNLRRLKKLVDQAVRQ